jgi:preprotein translocase subunit SecY
VIAITSLVTGAVFMMWLGEQITEKGVGNGISLLIFAGIVAGLPAAIGQSLEQARQGEINILVLLSILAIAIAVIYMIVFIERGQRRITVNYAKRQQGRKMYQAQSSHLPLKVNMSGVIPAIFASSILLFPASIAQWFGSSGSADWLQDLAVAIGPGQPLNILLFTDIHCLLLLLLHGIDVQPAGGGGQPEAFRGVCSRYPSRPADGQLH